MDPSRLLMQRRNSRPRRPLPTTSSPQQRPRTQHKETHHLTRRTPTRPTIQSSNPNTQPPPDLYTSYLQIIKNWLPTVAPNAELLTTTYQPLPAPGDYICPATPEANKPIPLQIPLSNKAEEILNNNIKTASQKAGIRTIDIHNAAKGHDTCNPDDNQRWIAGWWAPTTTQNMVYHPTINGTNAIGKIVADQL
ncbi:MAG: hypothetical protein E7L40_03515 [Corynebacterium kroppenstedtii]|nr:hypothetical protein [Corynebacterium kroppenstedtii]